MLKFSGIGSAFNAKEGNTSAYIEQDDSFVLIDCGSTVFESVKPKIDSVDPNNIHIFITHTHADHIGSLGTTIDYINHVKKGKANIYFPCEQLKEILDLMKVSADGYTLHKELNNTVNRLAFSFYQTSHILGNCYGLLIKHDNQTICYSGDCNEITLLQDFLQGKINIMYLDVTDKDSTVHVTYRDLVNLIVKPIDRDRLYLMHLNEDFNKIKAINDGFNLAERE